VEVEVGVGVEAEIIGVMVMIMVLQGGALLLLPCLQRKRMNGKTKISILISSHA
jgi:hypothetical protein